jgi:pimeloyl-ACP methyl ester carboxylesterase
MKPPDERGYPCPHSHLTSPRARLGTVLCLLPEREVDHPFLDTVDAESLKLPHRVWRDYMKQAALSIDHDYVLALREIDAPTLILWGEQEPLFPREEQERLAAAIPGATLKLSLRLLWRRCGVATKPLGSARSRCRRLHCTSGVLSTIGHGGAC